MKNTIKLILLITIFITSLAANDEKISMQWLKQQPKSFAKDFYIWRYLNQNISPNQAKDALSQVRYLNNKIFYRYITKSKDPILKDYKQCMKSKTKNLLDKEAYCIEAGLSVYDATKLSKKQLKKIIDKTKDEYPHFTKKLEILHSPIPFKTLIDSDPKVFFDTFTMTGNAYRSKYFNQYIPLKLFKKLKDADNKKGLALTIKLIVTNLNMRKAQISLLKLNPEGLEYKTVFHLAINAIRHKKEDLALVYLNDAYNKAYYQMEKDNITFWQYQLTRDEKYLTKLSKSWDVNIYTLFANDTLKQDQKNIVYDLQLTKGELKYDMKNPFRWLKVLRHTKKMSDKKFKYYQELFTTDDTLGHLAFVKERHVRYKKSYFVTPYKKYVNKLNKDRQALIYAIGRQESRFIPTSISSAYAMGVMQIMPFLSKAIAKQLKEPYDIDKQLEAKTNLRYANHHLNYLTRKLNNPLFVAYAYNGGIGFTKRSLKTGLFKKGKYEPWLSMELIRYDETKKYGKKVLANYFVYQNYLNKENKLFFPHLIQKIKNL